MSIEKEDFLSDSNNRVFRAPEKGPAELLKGEEQEEAKKDILEKKRKLRLVESKIAKSPDKKSELFELGDIKDMEGLLKEKILTNKGEYSEDLVIKDDGTFESQNPDGSLTSLFANLSEKPENIYLFAKKIQEEFPELEFTFEKDKHGKKIKYTVKERE